MLATGGSLAVVVYAIALVLLVLARVAARPPGDAVRRGWIVSCVVAVLGIALHAVWLAPLFVGSDRGSSRPDLTVMTANLKYGAGDAGDVVGAVRQRGVDVLVLEEVTPASLQRLTGAGLQRRLPRSEGQPSDTARGTMVFSRYALRGVEPVALSNGGLEVRVAAPEPFTLLAVHNADPLFKTAMWGRDLGLLQERAVRAARSGPVLLAGDFNTTPDHAYFRRLLGAAGLRDAAEQAGSGLQPTWPSKRGLVPLITIDHVLSTSAYAAVRTDRVAVPGSDHRALVADLQRVAP